MIKNSFQMILLFSLFCSGYKAWSEPEKVEPIFMEATLDENGEPLFKGEAEESSEEDAEDDGSSLVVDTDCC